MYLAVVDSTIVMLTRVVELGKEKCSSYWPQGVGSSCKYEGIKVTLKREEKYVCYFRREMEVTGPDSSSYSCTYSHEGTAGMCSENSLRRSATNQIAPLPTHRK